MRFAKLFSKFFLLIGLGVWLSGCGGSGGGGDDDSGPTVSSFELVDPTPAAGDQFGEKVVVLTGGNIVVTDPNDSSVAANNGAVHLYNPFTQSRIASYYGDLADDQLGSGGITALPNGNFLIVSPLDNEGAVILAGTVRLIDGATGAPIGTPITGENTNPNFDNVPRIGDRGVTVLANGNYVIVSPNDWAGGFVRSGSVRLVDGDTGAQVSMLTGSAVDASVGNGGTSTSNGVTALPNGDYVIISRNENGFTGTVRLMNGTTGAQIGTEITGDNMNEFSASNVFPLTNGNYVIAAPGDEVGGIFSAGSVRLVDDATGMQIGNAITGDDAGDSIGGGSSLAFLQGITALANGNYVIASPIDDVGGIVDAGSVRLVSGFTGNQIGTEITGDDTNDNMGLSAVAGLPNSNYVIATQADDVGGILNAGSSRLVDGTTGLQIGPALEGADLNDSIGFLGTTVLANGNYVSGGSTANFNVVNGGSLRLINGTSGIQIGAAIEGDAAGDIMGRIEPGARQGVFSLSNNNFVIASTQDDQPGSEADNVGSVRLFDGATGAQIGTEIGGDVVGDSLGSGSVFTLANGNYVVISPLDDEGGDVNVGSVRLVNGATGAQIGPTVVGDSADDLDQAAVSGSASGSYYVLSAPLADNNTLADSGRVQLVAP